jgi:hypothetical protein
MEEVTVEPSFENVVGQDDLTRFDRKGGNKPNKKKKRKNKNYKGGNRPKNEGPSKK